MIQLRQRRLTVALADERWRGHHPTYFKEFTASLLRLGHRVIALCREPAELRDHAAQTCADLGVAVDDSLRAAVLAEPRRPPFIPGRFDHDPLSTVARWRLLRRALDTAERESGWRADFVFLPWLDSYLRFSPSASLPSRILARPWGGLYFRNHHFATTDRGGFARSLAKGDRCLRDSACRAVGVLDERYARTMENHSGRPVFQFPDITNESEPVPRGELAAEVLSRAGGRKIIGMVGLERRKGFLTMLRIAEATAGREPWFFVAGGCYCPETCTEDERRYAESVHERVRAGRLDNLHFEIPGARVEDGPEYNSLLEAFDVIYAAYERFQGSSNALTKAAVFHRPLVATAGECVGRRVEEFGMGLTIPEGDAAAGEQAIRAILAGEGRGGAPLAPRYGDYHAMHDRDRLDAVFAEILATV